MAAVVEEDPFRCSVCFEPLRDPVSIPCGHNYCMKCINGCWDQEEQKGEFSCPQCRETFAPRPVLRKNTMLAELVDKMRKTGFQTASPPPPAPSAEPGDLECDLCTDIKLKAVKSCLVCLISLCQTHIEPHYNMPAFKNHTLVQASRHLQQKICSQHDRLIEVFCRTDQKCICMLCTMDEHRGHDTVSAAAERKEKENELGKTRTEFQQRIQKREKELQELRKAVASYQRSAQEAEQHSEKIFKELLESIERRRSEVKELIRAQQKAAVKDAEDVLEKLEQELAELRRGHDELEKLSLEEDHVHVLQSFHILQSFVSKTPDSLNFSPYMSCKDLSISLSALKSDVEEVCKQDIIKISQVVAGLEIVIPQPKTRKEFLKYCCKVTLDPNTAHKNISLSEGNKRATQGKEESYPYHRDRFTTYCQVLGEQGFCGRAYWEVELDLEKAYEIAVVYKSIGTRCNFRNDEKSWCLLWSNGKCSFLHPKGDTQILIIPTSRIGVFVDHRHGILSFYNVSDTMILLHKVKAKFTEPLYPGFWMSSLASVKLCI